jgi:site-specific DNA-cytosine methylase
MERAGIGAVSVGGELSILMGINVLSVFDGMACGLVALKRAGIQVDNYYASEIDPYAMKIAKKNHPEIRHVGDVQKWQEWDSLSRFQCRR